MGYDIEKEKREAIEAGQRALSSLRTAEENLNSAKNWGLVDMFGGGFFSTMLKHSKMDQAIIADLTVTGNLDQTCGKRINLIQTGNGFQDYIG